MELKEGEEGKGRRASWLSSFSCPWITQRSLPLLVGGEVRDDRPTIVRRRDFHRAGRSLQGLLPYGVL